MDIKKIGPTTWEIDGVVRIDQGPRRKTAIATEELLRDENTAAHYFAGERDVHANQVARVGTPRTKLGETVKVRGVDAMGKPIELGKPMTYIDHLRKEPEIFRVKQLAWSLIDPGKDQAWWDGLTPKKREAEIKTDEKREPKAKRLRARFLPRLKDGVEEFATYEEALSFATEIAGQAAGKIAV